MSAIHSILLVTLIAGASVGAAPVWAQTLSRAAPSAVPQSGLPAGPGQLASGELRSFEVLIDQSGKPFEAFNADVVAGSLNSRLTAIQTWMTEAESRIVADETQIAALEQQVQTLQAALSNGPVQPASGPTADQVAKLEARVSSLEKNRGRVTAPFKVVDGAGKSVFEVNGGGGDEVRGLSLINSAGQLVMFAAAVGSGGVVQVRDTAHTKAFVDLVASDGTLSIKATPDGGATGATVSVKDSGVTSFQMTGPGGIAAAIDGNTDGGALTLYDKDGSTAVTAQATESGGIVRAEKPGDDTTYVAMGVTDGDEGLRVRSAGKSKAYIGTQPDGSGVAYVFGSTEVPAAGLQTYESGRGEIAVFNASGTPVAYLDEGEKLGGNVTLTDPSGQGVFSAGFDGDEGAACVGHKGTLHCLGIGLPLMGGGN